MTTGKTETAYEFNCEHGSADIWCREGCHAETDRTRLEREVVEGAKSRRPMRDAMLRQGTIAACDEFSEADNCFENALTTLLEFEAKQK